jgi:hypothetical protein
VARLLAFSGGRKVHPLIYDFRTRRVCIQTGMNFYEFVRQIADDMHAQGKLCTGNLGHDPHTRTFRGILDAPTGLNLWFPHRRFA